MSMRPFRPLVCGIALLGLPAAGCLAPTPDFVDPRGELLLEWIFDHGAAGTVLDTTDYGHDLELEGAILQSEKGLPFARFDGTADQGRGPDLQSIVPELTEITIEARVRITDATSDWTPRPIVSIPQSSNEGNYALSLTAFTSAQRMLFSLSADEHYVQLQLDWGYQRDVWHTLHGTYDGSRASLFIDGELGVDAALSGVLSGYLFSQQRQVVYVAADSLGEGRLACDIASIRVYGRGLTPDEVAHRHAQLQ